MCAKYENLMVGSFASLYDFALHQDVDDNLSDAGGGLIQLLAFAFCRSFHAAYLTPTSVVW